MTFSEFHTARENLQQARVRVSEARKKVFLAREKLKKIDVQSNRLERLYNPENAALEQQRHALLEAKKTGEKEIRGLLNVAADYQLDHKRLQQIFEAQIDPRQDIENLSDSYPILLMPVRVETRFKTVRGGATDQHQLWVRVFPDEAAIDSFEPILSETEVENARRFWIDTWRSGGDPDADRAAWRNLVAAHGSQRAIWIKSQYYPNNAAADTPVRNNADEIILVITSDTILPDNEATAAKTYWSKFWAADGDADLQATALLELINNVGQAAAGRITQNFVPFNLNDRPAEPLTPADVTVTVAIMLLPKPDEFETKKDSWTQPARVYVMPDRFVLLGFLGGQKVVEELGRAIPSPLVVGPDPSATDDEQLKEEDGELKGGEDIKWLFDFDRAVETGMGFKVSISAQEYQRGFDRLIVVGLRLSSDHAESQALLEALIKDRQYSRSGMEIVPQGTPTNNVDDNKSGFTHRDDSDDSFGIQIGGNIDLSESNWLKKKDGQWLAESLGIDCDALKHVLQASGTDMSEARAMNFSLWPATMGYCMGSMMDPVFDDKQIADTHWFFTNFVLGRGIIPAVRFGQQPYGILPATAFSRMRWFDRKIITINGLDHPVKSGRYLGALYRTLQKVDSDWDELLKKVSFIGKNGDAHQIILDIVGLHSGSVSYYQRWAESAEHLLNRMKSAGLGGKFVAALIALGYTVSGMDLLRSMGYQGEVEPDILHKLFVDKANPLTGDLIDDSPLSETDMIRAYTPDPDSLNYIAWLIKAGRTSLDTIRLERGFIDNKPPRALLYLMLRHALTLGYLDAGLNLYQSKNVLTAQETRQARREPNFIHISGNVDKSESHWYHLYRAEPQVTGHPSLNVADFIAQRLQESPELVNLRAQIDALEYLKDIPTARLERVFSEHIDTITYRYDAWKLGLVNCQLAHMRYGNDNGEASKGIYLGMFGWLEDVRSERKILTPVKLEDELAELFDTPGAPPLMSDSTNGGYIHAPSLNHGVAAAVLRNGYLANATPEHPQTLSINLSSERVRKAIGIIEGIRNEQSLGALLGYHFERGLHDSHYVAEVDEFILDLRKAFPLVADNIEATASSESDAIDTIEARNVLDGLKLVNHVQTTNQRTYPFGKNLKPATSNQAAAINAEVDRLRDLHDAVADIALSESVYQVVQGNYDRAAASLDAYSKSNFPPLPDIARTPRSGIHLNHRVAVHLEAGLDPQVSPIPNAAMTPRAKAEPALNKWLSQILPPADKVFCRVSYYSAVDRSYKSDVLTQEQLQLQPIDLLYLISPETRQAMSALDDRIQRYVVANLNPLPSSVIAISYQERETDLIPFFELAALIRSLCALVLQSRPLRPNDSRLNIDTSSEDESKVNIDIQRLKPQSTLLAELKTELQTFQTTLKTLLDHVDLDANRNTIITNIDTYLDTLSTIFAELGEFGLPETGTGVLYAWKRIAFTGIFSCVRDLTSRWQGRLDQYASVMAEYAALPAGATDEERYALLRKCEVCVASSATAPQPNTPAAYEAVLTNRHAQFVAKKALLDSHLSSNVTSLAQLRADVLGELPLDSFDTATIDLTESDRSIIAFARDLQTYGANLEEDLKSRLNVIDEQLLIFEGSSDSEAKVGAALQIAAQMFGEDFRLVPEYEMTADQSAEWNNCLGASDDLLKHLTDVKQVAFPVDNWLYGLGRVREKMHHWENVTFLTHALGKPEPGLTPLQLPYLSGDSWLALDHPDDYKIDSDRLLYTVHLATPHPDHPRQCGILLDEWTEVIPEREETTGLAFHYDRPNSEPPQAMLLVTPPDFTGKWLWPDLVDAITETMELARKRAVEPDQIDDTVFARFLPATIMAVTKSPITIMANLALNNSQVVEGD